jgi:hypothetical protein
MKNKGHWLVYQRTHRQDTKLHNNVGSQEFTWRRCSVLGTIPGLQVNQRNSAVHQVARVRGATQPK